MINPTGLRVDKDEENSLPQTNNNIQTSKENDNTSETVKLDINDLVDNECKTTVKENNTIDQYVFTEFDTNLTNRKITNLDELPSVDLIDDDLFLNKSFSESVKTSKAMLWHVRMGHASVDYLRKLQSLWRDNKDLQSVIFDDEIRECEICALTKLLKLPFKNQRSRAERPLQIIHSDVIEKISPSTHPFGYQYIIVFIDDYSRMALTYPMKTKDATGRCLDRFITTSRNLLGTNKKICYL